MASFQCFSSSDNNHNVGLLGFDSQPTPLPPPPPCVEILASEVSTTVKYTVEPVNVGDFTLLKGRVSTQEVFALSNFDLVPGKYEGGLKMWEGSLDLVKALQSEIQSEHLSFTGKRVIELGCGHGLPGLFACLQGAATVHFQDFNSEVLQCLTIPNVNSNLKSLEDSGTSERVDRDIRFFAGDWRDVHQLLPHARDGEKKQDCASATGYDIVLMAETVYSITMLPHLYELVKKCMGHPGGFAYMAAKKHYFGVDGGTRRFLSVAEKDGVMVSELVAEVVDGSSNVREVWKLSFK